MQSKMISILVLALVFAFGAGTGHAEELNKAGKPLTAQQARMKNCNAKAKADALKGEERKAFMSTCLKAPAADAGSDKAGKTAPVIAKAPSAKQVQRKACGAEAKEQGLKGEERKDFVKDCMKRPQAQG